MADNNNNNITNTVTPSNPVLRTTRSDSTSSASTDSTVGSPPARRSSYLFGGLEAQKRRTDPESMARRQSMNEQRPAAGFFGKMWNEYVRGK